MLNNFMAFLTVAFLDLKEREEGQGLVEYTLILVLISIVSIALMSLLGFKIGEVFNKVTTTL